MKDSNHHHPEGAGGRLRAGIVVRVREDACELVTTAGRTLARYASMFPSPRAERVSPGHLVAVATASDGAAVVIWRWYDAVVIGPEDDLVRMWEPSHGEVLAHPRPTHRSRHSGSRAYLSAGLPGADWWVAGRATAHVEAAEVEFDDVERLFTEHDLWHGLDPV